jgi:hypothetical protein
LRKLINPFMFDGKNFIADHASMIYRLSRPPAPTAMCLSSDMSPPELGTAGQVLLLQVLKEKSEFLKRLCCRPLSKEATAVVAFIEHPLVFDSKVWLENFRLRPPHGTVARIARKLGTVLHESCQAWKFKNPSAFREELCTIRNWYRRSWKMFRRKRGILRGKIAERYVPGSNVVFSKKVEAHYKRLEKNVRFEGMWNWSEVATGMHAAGIAMQTGTVPVERLWSSLKSMLPVEGRNMSRSWLELLLDLAFFRYNYRHFRSKTLPSWTQDDSLLASRLESLSSDFEHLLGEAMRKESEVAGVTP